MQQQGWLCAQQQVARPLPASSRCCCCADTPHRMCVYVRSGIVLKVLFHPKQLLLFSSCDAGQVRVWDLVTKSCVHALTSGHMSAVPALALSPDGWYLLSGGRDMVVCAWDIRSGARVATTPVYEALEGAWGDAAVAVAAVAGSCDADVGCRADVVMTACSNGSTTQGCALQWRTRPRARLTFTAHPQHLTPGAAPPACGWRPRLRARARPRAQPFVPAARSATVPAAVAQLADWRSC